MNLTKSNIYIDSAFLCKNLSKKDLIILNSLKGKNLYKQGLKDEGLGKPKEARLIQLAFNAGSRIEIDLMPVMLKRLSFTGSTLRSRSDQFKADVAADLRTLVWPLFARGATQLRATTFARFMLADAAKAHVMMESASKQGKILLTI